MNKVLKLQIARDILNEIRDKIHIVKQFESDEDKAWNGTLNTLRKSLHAKNDPEREKTQAQYIDNLFERFVAPAFLGVGACSNVASYFAWQYFCKTGLLDVTLVSTSNCEDYQSKLAEASDHRICGRDLGPNFLNHMFVMLGPCHPSVQLDKDEHIVKTPRNFSLNTFLSVQRQECIIVDPFYNHCFDLNTDEINKQKFLQDCITHPYIYEVQFYHQRSDFLSRLEQVGEQIRVLAQAAQEEGCLNALNLATKLLLKDSSPQWKRIITKKEGVTFCFTLSEENQFSILRNFLRQEQIYDKNRITKQSSPTEKNPLLRIMEPEKLNLYGLIFQLRAMRDEAASKLMI